MKKHNPGFEALCEAARKQVKEASVEQVKEMMDNGTIPLVLDVREESEWGKDHLPGARHLGRGVLERDIETVVPDKATPMVLYCGGGYRSALAAESLQKMGYTGVISMDGGYRGWNEAGYPLVKE
ncbi:sulfurtransferase [Leminorella grimontii]|uniref:Sulfurtransferase n=1 Tax=Leminorella grimontii TaxID=82981 RepID=A0AAV5N0X7_9GAMM|nr:rhodanese-like domain-containing protein [Leminorella grimontii]KFC97466.1 rhodanese domain protein [Leminorella grimontii ATCC 33999 = DSM 5078]GKX55173.1 sulfurtransferase [Leminorella grimontii]GKX58598.1 sulfurtransferase [Leminorella grimontii]VFS56803.1 Thiosulfate sulfurtransferase PspE precursor [Leminorella grimontii]